VRVLITGASGFIGGHLDRELRDAGHLVAGVELAGGGDLRRAIHDHRAEVVVHLECGSSGLLGEENVLETVLDTAGVTAEVAQECGNAGARFVVASTDQIYGDVGGDISTEEGPFGEPSTTYAIAKLMGESLGYLYAPVGLTVLRIASAYGPGNLPGRDAPAIMNLLRAAEHGEPMLVHEGAERSWCWVGDTVRGIRIAIERGNGVYNIGRDDDRTSMQEVAEIICSITGADKSLIETVEKPARQTLVRRLSVKKLRMLGWEPQVSLYEGLEMTRRWLAHLDETNESFRTTGAAS
jgi:nucleoside-diphosphate-sugar epimerase